MQGHKILCPYNDDYHLNIPTFFLLKQDWGRLKEDKRESNCIFSSPKSRNLQFISLFYSLKYSINIILRYSIY